MDNFWKYFLLGSLFWVIVDFTTVFNPDITEWIRHMPLVWLFYLGSPLLFSYLIYRKKWDDKKLFLPVMLVLILVEIIVCNNALLFTFPIMFIMIPAAVSIYSFITYVPRWIVDNKLLDHKASSAIMLVVWAIIAILSYVTRVRG